MSNTKTQKTMSDTEFIAAFEAKEAERKAKRQAYRNAHLKKARELERAWRALPSSKVLIREKNQRQAAKAKAERERYLELVCERAVSHIKAAKGKV